ncbi:hypothetical protein ACRQ1B_24005 [Rhizobium panacihumi]|uniref:hypothetical protein n=1 Tax=Rhizobium panacihumi TaxID=2008450 RepID=UPI003D792483
MAKIAMLISNLLKIVRQDKGRPEMSMREESLRRIAGTLRDRKKRTAVVDTALSWALMPKSSSGAGKKFCG